MIAKIKNELRRCWINLPGWRTHRKIVVIESDDWGSIRMPSKQVFKKCLSAGYRVDKIAYERFDSLASQDDLELLFEVLSRHIDHKGNSAVITANVLTSNPDFEKIKASDYREYYYELITDTFEKYPNHGNCFNLWEKGKEEGVFFPQSHGREHLNVSLFMKALREGDKDALFGFEHGMPGCIPKCDTKGGNKYVETLRYLDQSDKENKLYIIAEGLDLFEKLFGFCSKSFIPPNHIWNPDYNELISSLGVKYYQGRRKMKEILPDGTVKLHSHKLGEENEFGQKYLIRNATFEPALSHSGEDSVDKCLKDINIAFRMKKPAIICSHRLNYVGFIDPDNRDKNLTLLNKLLKNIIKKWPEVEFMNSVELGSLIEKKYK